MEPMALGSAPSSPATPGGNPNYLPAFLMGETQPATPNQSINMSPDRQRNYSYNLSTMESGSLRQQLFSPNAINTGRSEPVSQILSPQSSHDTSVHKTGPPKQGLFDSFDTKKPSGTLVFGNLQQSAHSDSSSVNRNDSMAYNTTNDVSYGYQSTLNESLSRAGSLSALPTFKSDTIQNLWVTVFGFPTSSTSLLLARFSNCGTIVDKRFPTQGNWVHLKFSSPSETAKALALNGKLIANNIMIGVMPHQVKQASNKENFDTSYTSPIRARSLRHSFVSPQHSNTVLPPQNVPQKSTGLVTKAMEYVFGW